MFTFCSHLWLPAASPLTRTPLLFIAIVTLCACGGKKTDDTPVVTPVVASTIAISEYVEEAPAEEEEAVTYATRRMDELFDDFIFTFADNKRLQRQRISFPLHLNAFGDDMVIERSEWEHQDLFDGLDCYTSFLSNADDESEIDRATAAVDFENINLDDETVRTLHFDRQDGRWMLTRETLSSLHEHEMADFLLFYRRFATDSLFAAQSLSRTIHFVTDDPDDDFARIEGIITADQWPAFAPELPANSITNIDYGQPLTGTGQVIMSIRGISNGLVDELTFSRTGDGWVLTKYEN